MFFSFLLPIYLIDDMIDSISPSDPMSQFFAKFLSLWYEEERKQTIRRIKSGLKQAQRQDKWVGRPPKGFKTNKNGKLVPDLEEFLTVQSALERIEDGESYNSVSNDSDINRTTLQRLHQNPEKKKLYLEEKSNDDRIHIDL